MAVKLGDIRSIRNFRLQEVGRCAVAAHGTEGLNPGPDAVAIPITVHTHSLSLSLYGCRSARYFLDRSICTSPRSRIVDERVIGWPRSAYTPVGRGRRWGRGRERTAEGKGGGGPE